LLDVSVTAFEKFTDVEKARRDLEGQSLEASSTAQAVTFITIVQQCGRSKSGDQRLTYFGKGRRHSLVRYQFAADWLFVEQIDHEWTALNEILGRKSKIVQDQTDALR
jgi:dynein heavy chain 1